LPTVRCSTLLDAARRCSTLLDAARRCSTLLDAARRCSTLLDAARRNSTLLDADLAGRLVKIKDGLKIESQHCFIKKTD
jgi:hypothetical protein